MMMMMVMRMIPTMDYGGQYRGDLQDDARFGGPPSTHTIACGDLESAVYHNIHHCRHTITCPLATNLDPNSSQVPDVPSVSLLSCDSRLLSYWQWCFSDAVCTLPEKCNFILAVCRDSARDEYFGKDQNSFAPRLGPSVCPKSCPSGQKCVQGVCISSSG